MLLAERAGATLKTEKGTRAKAVVTRLGGQSVALAVPTTYMNDSGSAYLKKYIEIG
jgi:peptidyl-tRNA hydrolase